MATNHQSSARDLTSDSETRVHQDDHIALRLWLRLLTCTNLIETQLRSRLRTEFDTTLPRFDLLAQLDREPDGLTMGMLSKRMMVSGGNVTGLVNQLLKDGYITKTAHPDSGRTFVVSLTKSGRAVFKAMAEEHEAWVQGMFAQLSEEQMQQLMTSLAGLKKSAGK